MLKLQCIEFVGSGLGWLHGCFKSILLNHSSPSLDCWSPSQCFPLGFRYLVFRIWILGFLFLELRCLMQILMFDLFLLLLQLEIRKISGQFFSVSIWPSDITFPIPLLFTTQGEIKFVDFFDALLWFFYWTVWLFDFLRCLIKLGDILLISGFVEHTEKWFTLFLD